MKKEFSPWWLLIAAIVCTAVLAYAYGKNESFVPNIHAEALGQLGDFFGGLLNPVVSILTLIVAINVWRLQKAELELTRHEMAETKEAMEDQAKTAEQQRREQRFFDLLNLYKETVDSIEFEESYGFGDNRTYITLKGKRAFSQIISNAGLQHYTVDIEHSPTSPIEPNVRKANKLVGMFLDHYFRVVFTLLREAEPMLGDQHYRYVKLFRAQLSRNELTALAFNLIHSPEGKDMQTLICNYGLLKHLHDCHLRRWAEQKVPPAAFGRKYEAAFHNVLAEIHAP